MTKLLTTLKLSLAAVALPLLGGCAAARSHIGPSIDVNRREVSAECPTAESCPPPTSSTVPTAPLGDLTGAEGQACLAAGGSAELCADPPPPAPNPTVPPADDSAEGGAPVDAPAGVPYFGE